MGRLLAFAALALSASLLPGCSTLSYLYQAGKGQFEIANRARPIADVLKDERTSPRLKSLLEEIPRIKKFGEDFGLKATSNYVDYVKLDRTAASYVVSACPPFDLKPREWSFPIVGSFTYLGWFDLGGAKKQAEALKAQGLDVDLRGARAFSTLGWFRDPVLSTMISEGDTALGELVNVIIHESVHATFYLKGQSYFNESIASFVADRLTPVYLERTRGKDDPALKAWRDAEEEGKKREHALHGAYQRLASLYASDLSAEMKLKEKTRILAQAQTETGFKRPINNATLAQFRTYGVGETEYSTLFRACGDDWLRFWAAVKGVGGGSFQVPQQEDLAPVLLPIARDGCPAAKK